MAHCRGTADVQSCQESTEKTQQTQDTDYTNNKGVLIEVEVVCLFFFKYLDGGSGFHFIFIFGIVVMPTWSSSTEGYVLLPAYAKHVKPELQASHAFA